MAGYALCAALHTAPGGAFTGTLRPLHPLQQDSRHRSRLLFPRGGRRAARSLKSSSISGLNLVSAAAQQAADSEGEAGGREVLPVELPQQACVSPGSTATLAVLFIPATLEEDEEDVALFLRGPAGEALPPLSSAALALPPLKRVVCCAFDGPSGSLLVSDGSSLVALDADRRAVRWVIPLPHTA